MSSNGDQPRTLKVAGTINGIDLDDLGAALEIVALQLGETVVVDVSDVENWFLIAQAMLLTTARRLTSSGGQLVLEAPTDDLRGKSAKMGPFDRVPTHSRAPAPGVRIAGLTVNTVALLIVDRRRVLMMRTHTDGLLTLPGGRLGPGSDPRDTVTSHAYNQPVSTSRARCFASL